MTAVSAERFTAWAMCPNCERVDCHSLRAPQPFDPTDPTHVALDRISTMLWITGHDRMPASEEARYEVIRTCRCGHEWGQL